MKKLLTYLGWLFLGMAVLLVVLGVALSYYTRTEDFREWARDRFVSTVNESIRGSVAIDGIEGSIWGNVVLHNVRLRHENAKIVHIPRLAISYSWFSLLQGQFQVSQVQADDPAVRLERDAEDRWNITEALASDGEGESGLAVGLKSIIVRRGTLELYLAGTPPKSYRLHTVNLRGGLELGSTGLTVDVRQISSRLRSAEMPELGLKGRLLFQDSGTSAVLEAKGFVVEHGNSVAELNGKITDFASMNVAATVGLKRLAAPDVAAVIPGWPVKPELSGRVDINGPPDALAIGLNLAAAEARVGADLKVDISRSPPRYSGTVKVAGVDGQKLIENKVFGGVLAGNFTVRGEGVSLAGLEAAGTVNVESAEYKGWKLGNVELEAAVNKKAAKLAGRLKSEIGGAEWRGTVGFEKVPRYEFDFTVRNLDVKKVSDQENPLHGMLNFSAKVKGSGANLSETDTKAEINIQPSKFGPLESVEGTIAAGIAKGKIRLMRATLRTAGSTLTAKGDFGVDLSQRGNLEYKLRSDELSRWLALVGRKGDGSLELEGRARGNLARIETQGKMKVSSLDLEGVTVKNGNVDFNLTRENGEMVPQGSLKLRLADIQAGMQIQTIDGSIKLINRPARSVQFTTRLQDSYGGKHHLVGSVDYGQPEIVARLQQASFSLPEGLWQLAQPATVTKREDKFLVQKFFLRNGDRQLSVDGSIATRGAQALAVTVDRLPLEGLAPFLPKQSKITGVLAVKAQIQGTAAAPEVSATIDLKDSQIAGQKYAGLTGNVSYKDRNVDLKFLVRQDSNHGLDIVGKVPLILSWQGGWRLELGGNLDVRMQSSGLSLTFLNAYGGKLVEGIEGEVSADVVARGPVKAPSVSGTFSLRGGKIKALPLGLNIHDVTADGLVDSTAIKLQKLSARAEEGHLSGSGHVNLENYQLGNFKLALVGQNWPVVQTRRYQAVINGKSELEGSLTAQTLTGNLEVVEAAIRPDLSFLDHGTTPVKRDETIVIVHSNKAKQITGKKTDKRDAMADNEWFKNLGMDVAVAAPGKIWIRHRDARIELAGNLRANKKSQGNLALTGVTRILRGWVSFKGRRFNFTRGELRFTGGSKIDPALDIVAEHRLPQYRVNAIVGGTAEAPSLTLESEPALDQADILALLLFGKPIQDLNKGEQESLEQNAVDVTSGFVAAEIGAEVSRALGLDRLGLDIGELDIGGGRVGFGRYIGSDTYVSIDQEFSGDKGQEVSLEYRIAPGWKIGTSTDTEGSSDIKLIWEKRY